MVDDDLARQKLAVYEVFYEFFNNNRQPIAQKHFNYNFTCRFNQYTLTGSVELIRFVKQFRTLFPDTHIEIASIFSEGDMVCAQWKMLVTSHESEQVLSTNGITIFRFRSGKIIQVEQQLNVGALITVYKRITQRNFID